MWLQRRSYARCRLGLFWILHMPTTFSSLDSQQCEHLFFCMLGDELGVVCSIWSANISLMVFAGLADAECSLLELESPKRNLISAMFRVLRNHVDSCSRCVLYKRILGGKISSFGESDQCRLDDVQHQPAHGRNDFCFCALANEWPAETYGICR